MTNIRLGTFSRNNSYLDLLVTTDTVSPAVVDDDAVFEPAILQMSSIIWNEWRTTLAVVNDSGLYPPHVPRFYSKLLKDSYKSLLLHFMIHKVQQSKRCILSTLSTLYSNSAISNTP